MTKTKITLARKSGSKLTYSIIAGERLTISRTCISIHNYNNNDDILEKFSTEQLYVSLNVTILREVLFTLIT